jgi:ribosomal protein S18 acetylase RimI-like enzyme
MIEFTTPSVKDSKEIFLLGEKEFDWIFEKISWDMTLVEWFINNHNPYCFIARDGRTIVGFHLSFITGEMGYMGWACVSPNFRRQNITRELLRLTIAKMKENDKIRNVYSHVREDGICPNFLSRRGFVEINERKVEMKLSLKE